MTWFPPAPWPTMLRVTSLLGTAALVAVGVATAVAIPRGTRVPFAETFGILIAFVPPAIAAIAALFVVRGYEVGPDVLRVRRLLWSTAVPLEGLARIASDFALVKGSVRVFGNGGLFAFTGRYRNRALGSYRAFVTDWSRAVVLHLPGRVVVVSPAEPGAFVRALAARFPGAAVSA